MRFNKLIYLIFFLTLLSCGTKQQKSDDAIFAANVFLSNKQCDKALEKLGTVEAEFYDYYYYQALASAKACKADYAVLDIANDLDDYSSSNSFFNFLAGLTPSNETSATSNGFKYLEEGINSILFLKSTSAPTFTDRLAVISNRGEAEDLSFQALLMIFVYLGKWFAFFGDADTAGVKSLGTQDVNNCLLDYDAAGSQLTAGEQTALLGNTGTCSTAGAMTGSTHLVFGLDTTRDRLCTVIVYFNHIRDITGNITLSSNDSLGDLSDAFDAMETYVTSSEAAFPGISNVLTFYDVSTCATYYDAANANKQNIHAFMAGVVEKNFL